LTKNTTSTISTINTNRIIIYQDGKENQIVTGEQHFTIKRNDFSIRFYNKKYTSQTGKYHAAQIAVLTDKEALQNINVGMDTSETTCFSPGTGMAAPREGYGGSIIIKNHGHHYLFYQDEEEKRVNLIGEKGELFKLEFLVNSVYENKKKIMLEDKPSLNEIYLAILIDRNSNEIIDKEELTKLTLKLK